MAYRATAIQNRRRRKVGILQTEVVRQRRANIVVVLAKLTKRKHVNRVVVDSTRRYVIFGMLGVVATWR